MKKLERKSFILSAFNEIMIIQIYMMELYLPLLIVESIKFKYYMIGVKKIEVAILGGSFNPPTIGHMSICSEILNFLPNIKEFWFIPCGDRNDKKLSATAAQRYQMTKLAVASTYPENSFIKVSDIEFNNGKLIPTAYLLQRLGDQYKDRKFHFIIGADLLNQLDKWDEPEYLYNEANIILMSRDGFEIDFSGKSYKIPKNHVYVKSYALGDRSSTDARKKLSTIKRDSAFDLCKLMSLIPKCVLEFVISEKLYLETN